MNRRLFIKLSLFTSIGLYSKSIGKKTTKKKTLILIELSGANDSLNTFVPYSSRIYYKLRPDIAINKSDLNIINNEFGLNNNLKYLYKLYKNKNIAIINGLGYKNPNFSHFKSIQLVETDYLNKGWLSEVLKDTNLNVKKPAHALIIGKKQKTYIFSKNLNILQIKNINKFINKSNKFKLQNEKFKFLNSQNNIIVKANESLKKYINNDDKQFNTKISNDIHEALKIIDSDIQIPVIKLTQNGYDTHSNQIKRQNALLEELDIALEYFIESLKKKNLFNDVLIVTYSEFGRRVKQNGSLGTDHGAAATHFVIGGSVIGGIYGNHPSLNKLDKNNLVYTTEYSSLYNTILSKWFNERNNSFKDYPMIDFI